MRVKEQFIWVGLATFFLVLIGIFAVAPNLGAEPTKDDTQQYLQMLERAFVFVQNNYVDEVTAKELFEGAMQGMFDSLDDPYSYYLTASDMEDLTDTTTGRFGGVGLYISKDAQFDPTEARNSQVELTPPFVRVVAPIEDTPAFRSGINAGDYITKIEEESTEEMTIDDVVNRLRGKPGTNVTITLLRDKDIVFDVTIKREIIEVPTVKYDMINDKIGYLRIIQFTPYTDDRIKDAIKSFEKENYNSLIIDVRGNPGGLLNSVVRIADYLLPKGDIVSTKSRIKSEEEMYSARPTVLVPNNVPIVLLIDKGSASASEILAGALKDNNRATLVGEKTFGKGSVQRVLEFGEGGIKLTMSRYYTPNDINIDKIGIAPHFEVKEKEFSEEESASYKRILEEKIIAQFIDKNRNPNQRAVNKFIRELKADGIVLADRILKKLVRNEINKHKNTQPAYDLEYDLALQKAVELIKK